MFRKFLFLILIIALALTVSPAAAKGGAPPSVESALQWLATLQQDDGGFTNLFAEGADLSTTADAVVAITSAGADASSVQKNGKSPLDYLVAQAQTNPDITVGQWAKIALALHAAGVDGPGVAREVQGQIINGMNPDTGVFGAGGFDQALTFLALHNMRLPVPPEAVDALLATRLDDGSYAFTGETTPGAGDSNTTAMAVMALAAVGRADELAPSIEYFRKTQNADGGWTYQKPSQFGEDTDANSTALVIQALIAAGETPGAWETAPASRVTPFSALLGLQDESGAFSFNLVFPGDNALATIQAIPALMNVSLDNVPVVPAANVPEGASLANPPIPTPSLEPPTSTPAPTVAPTRTPSPVPPTILPSVAAPTPVPTPAPSGSALTWWLIGGLALVVMAVFALTRRGK